MEWEDEMGRQRNEGGKEGDTAKTKGYLRGCMET